MRGFLLAIHTETYPHPGVSSYAADIIVYCAGAPKDIAELSGWV